MIVLDDIPTLPPLDISKAYDCGSLGFNSASRNVFFASCYKTISCSKGLCSREMDSAATSMDADSKRRQCRDRDKTSPDFVPNASTMSDLIPQVMSSAVIGS